LHQNEQYGDPNHGFAWAWIVAGTQVASARHRDCVAGIDGIWFEALPAGAASRMSAKAEDFFAFKRQPVPVRPIVLIVAGTVAAGSVHQQRRPESFTNETDSPVNRRPDAVS
jgi:hypothetical protein